MDNEQILLNLYKQQQFDETRTRLQKIFMIISACGSTIALVISLFFFESWWYIASFGSTGVCVVVLALLARSNVIKLNTACYITTIFSCFVFIPAFWILTSITGAAPYIAIIILVAMIVLFPGKSLKYLLLSFYIVLSILTAHSSLTFVESTSHDFIDLVYTIMAFWIAFASIVLYMLYKQKEFNELNDKFLRSSFKDELTQLYNRKLLELIMEYQESLYKRQHADYIFAMFDVDDFKLMNDEHGHVYGDIILRSVAECIHDTTREADFVVRYGGDEFLVIQTNASPASIQAFIARIEARMKTSCQLDIHIEISYGFASRSECDNPEALLKLADKRLYENKQAKKAGR